jgi:hypothetical protein
MLHDTNANQRNVAASTTEDVLRHHLSCFRKGDLSGLMEDYDLQAKFFTPNGILRGSTAIREFFSTLLEEFGKPGLSFESLREDIEGTPSTLFGKPTPQTTATNLACPMLCTSEIVSVAQRLG